MAEFSFPIEFNFQLVVGTENEYVDYSSPTANNGIVVQYFNGSDRIGISEDLNSGPITSEDKFSLQVIGNTPYIAYINPLDANLIYVKKYDGVNWVEVGSQPASEDPASILDMMVINNEPVIGYSNVNQLGSLFVIKFSSEAPAPANISPSSPNFGCDGSEITLTAETTAGGDDQFIFFEWSTGETSASIQISDPGIYNVTISNSEFGCPGITSISIEKGAADFHVIIDTFSGTEINCIDTEVTLDASASEGYRINILEPSQIRFTSYERDENGNFAKIAGPTQPVSDLSYGDLASSVDKSRVIFVTPNSESMGR